MGVGIRSGVRSADLRQTDCAKDLVLGVGSGVSVAGLALWGHFAYCGDRKYLMVAAASTGLAWTRDSR